MNSELMALDPEMPTQELRLHMGELTASEVRASRAAIRWANTHLLTLLQSEEIRERAVNAMVSEENQFDPPYISQARMFALAQAVLLTIVEAVKEGK